MCTVSFVPISNKEFVFTSNRDEAIVRVALLPQVYEVNGVEVWMPKDEKSGGSWIGISEHNRLVCLLNGGYKNHTKKDNYRMSRGEIVKQFLTTKNAAHIEALHTSFDNIEPFTLLVIDWNSNITRTEIVWDGVQMHLDKTADLKPEIWSSSTLYTDEMKQLRKTWFADYLKQNEMTQDSILNFHQNYSVGDKNIDLQIDRGSLKTVSVTSVHKKEEVLKTIYVDVLQQNTHTSLLSMQLNELQHV